MRKWRGRRGKIAPSCASSPGTSSTAGRSPDRPPVARRRVRGDARGVGVGRRAAAGGAAVVAGAAGCRVWGAGVHGRTSRGQVLPLARRARGAPARHREVVGRRRERDPRARRCSGDDASPAAARAAARAARDACACAPVGVWLGNIHATAHDGRVRRPTCGVRRSSCCAGRAVAGGDRRRLQHAHPGVPGFEPCGGHVLDWVFARGLACDGPVEVPARHDAGVGGNLSDHRPVIATLAR